MLLGNDLHVNLTYESILRPIRGHRHTSFQLISGHKKFQSFIEKLTLYEYITVCSLCALGFWIIGFTAI